MKKIIKKIYPIIIIIIFALLIKFYYENNVDDFSFVKKIRVETVLIIIILSFFYLITEGILLKRIVLYIGKKTSLLECFLVMNFTYFCNTFIQFTGLGYRIYYLKKNNKINIKDFIRFSIDTIICELLVFSFFGILFLFIFNLFVKEFNLNIFVYFIFLTLFIISVIYIFLLNYIVKFLRSVLKKINIIFFNKIFNFFLIQKSNKFKFYINQIRVFILQYLILFLIFFFILKEIGQINYVSLAFLTTSFVDFSFLFAITPYSVGISEIFTFFGTKGLNFSIAEIIVLINFFRLSMIFLYFIIGPIFFMTTILRNKDGM